MTPRTCLIVDDSRIIRKVARRIVEGLGFEVEGRVADAESIPYDDDTFDLVELPLGVMDGTLQEPHYRGLAAADAERAAASVLVRALRSAGQLAVSLVAGALFGAIATSRVARNSRDCR